VTLESVLNEATANARSTKIRVDEQRFHVAAMKQHKSDRPVGFIDG
jgi:hypothetical protein